MNVVVENLVRVPLEKVWRYWTEPEHITQWNMASDDWHSPRAENNLSVGGTFSYRMEARDGSSGFDFGGTYTAIVPHERIAYTIGDGRKVEVIFKQEGDEVRIMETFEVENENSAEKQKAGWQSILNHFKSYIEKI